MFRSQQTDSGAEITRTVLSFGFIFFNFSWNDSPAYFLFKIKNFLFFSFGLLIHKESTRPFLSWIILFLEYFKVFKTCKTKSLVKHRVSTKIFFFLSFSLKKSIILTSLAIPTLFFGFYPDPLINTIEVSISDLIETYNFRLASKM